MTTKYAVVIRDEDGREIERYTAASRGAAERYAALADEGTTATIERAPVARVHCAGGQYVGLIGDRPIRGTTSNVGLICRARTIEAAERLGVDFVE